MSKKPLTPLPKPNLKIMPVPRRLVLGFDTLKGQFTTLAGLCLLFTLAGLIGSFLILSNVTNNLNEIINNNTPSILAAQRINQAIQDADAKAADYQLYSRIALTNSLPGFDVKAAQLQAWDTIVNRRREAADSLFVARTNITYPGEAESIQTINDRFLAYIGRIDVMRDSLDRGHWEDALSAYKSARDILVGNLGNANLDTGGRSPEEQAKLAGWPNFDTSKSYLGIEANIHRLFAINNSYFEQARDKAISGLNLLILVSVALFAFMISGLGFLNVRTVIVLHRVINPGYLLALLLAIGAAITLIISLNQIRQDYQTIARDSFISVEAVANIRQLAADANADESRLLLSPDATGLNSTSTALSPDVRLAFRSDILTENFTKKQNQIKDQLKTAWNNITYTGELAALCKITAPPNTSRTCTNPNYALDSYLKLDSTIRSDFKQNQLAEAIKIDTGTSNQAFDSWDKALVELQNVNETEFNRSACGSLGVLKYTVGCEGLGYNFSFVPFLQVGIWIIFPLIALGIAGGFLLTYREF